MKEIATNIRERQRYTHIHIHKERNTGIKTQRDIQGETGIETCEREGGREGTEIDLDNEREEVRQSPKVSLPPALVCLPRDAPNLSPTTFHLSELHWISASLSDAVPNQPGPGGVSGRGWLWEAHRAAWEQMLHTGGANAAFCSGDHLSVLVTSSTWRWFSFSADRAELPAPSGRLASGQQQSSWERTLTENDS